MQFYLYLLAIPLAAVGEKYGFSWELRNFVGD